MSAALREERENTAQRPSIHLIFVQPLSHSFHAVRMVNAEQDTKLLETTETISQQRQSTAFFFLSVFIISLLSLGEEVAKALQAMTAERDQGRHSSRL